MDSTERLDTVDMTTRNKNTKNSNNDYSSKTLKTSFGEVKVDFPCDRKGEFDRIIKKKSVCSAKNKFFPNPGF